MTTMLDKVARALFDADWGDIRAESEWDGFGKKDYWRKSARAALLAIREPSEAIQTAVFEQALDVDWPDFGKVIDLILNEDKSQ